jgi:hypothetical protein
MITNTPIWAYYQPGFVDPLYVPYMKTPVDDGEGGKVPINTWAKQGSYVMFPKELVRKGWGMKYQRIFYDDPCGSAWEKDGMFCKQKDLEYEPIFYTEKAFIPRIQHWNAYGTKSCDERRNVSEPTDMRSVNPLTGRYEVSFPPRPKIKGTRYMLSPTTDSYL